MYLRFLFVFDGILDGLDLNSHHGEHFNRDTVEFIEATPRTSLSKTFVDVANRLHVYMNVCV